MSTLTAAAKAMSGGYDIFDQVSARLDGLRDAGAQIDCICLLVQQVEAMKPD